MRLAASCFLATVALLVSISKGDIWVDGSGAAGGDGSADRPFVTIGDALKVAIGGDTISIRKGIYRESVELRLSGTASRPTVLRAVPGDRVILSGFVPLSGWKVEDSGLYSTTVDGPVRDLYVGYKAQSVSCWPSLDRPMRTLKNTDAATARFTDSASLVEDPFLKELAGSPKSLIALLHFAKSSGHFAVSVSSLDVATGTIAVSPNKQFAKSSNDVDRYQLVNHPSLVKAPGEWAFEALGNDETKVYFKPGSSDDLKVTQFRKTSTAVLSIRNKQQKISNIRIEGLEICGSANYGVQIQRGENVVINECTIHHNAAAGVFGRSSTNVTVKDCMILANGTGISLASVQKAVLQGNDVAFNESAGITLAGNVTGKADGEPKSNDVAILNSYIHHHVYQGAASNVRCGQDVSGVKLKDCLLLYDIRRPTSEEQSRIQMENTFVLGAVSSRPAAGTTAGPKSAPFDEAVTIQSDANTSSHLVLRASDRGADMSKYAKDDGVEINGDGILRRLTAVSADAIEFAPALPARPAHEILVWNWKKSKSTTLDPRPVVGLDVAAFQRGEFAGNGKRSLPPFEKDVQAGIPELHMLPMSIR